MDWSPLVPLGDSIDSDAIAPLTCSGFTSKNDSFLVLHPIAPGSMLKKLLSYLLVSYSKLQTSEKSFTVVTRYLLQ